MEVQRFIRPRPWLDFFQITDPLYLRCLSIPRLIGIHELASHYAVHSFLVDI